MEQICKQNFCSGCGACVNICPQKCITLVEDLISCNIPQIDQGLCINCNACKKVCPQNNLPELHYPSNCFAAKITSEEKRLQSASGGIARAFYEYVLSNINNSNVVGVYINSNYDVNFILTNKIEDIPKFQGSKYTQANPGMIYSHIADKLKKGSFVLFIAMPCQIAGLKNYLNLKMISQEKLLTVDILCHGVSPQSYFKQSINHIKKKYKFKTIDRISFRSNEKYKNFHLYVAGKNEANNAIFYNKYAYEDPYFSSFLKGISLRESCYQCKFSQASRISDITIGDFIGLAESKNYPEFKCNAINMSIILTNTKKGYEFLTQIDNIKLYERPYAEAIEFGASLQKSFPRHKLREKFTKEYKKEEFVSTINKIAFKDLLLYKILNAYKKIYVHIFMRHLLK